MSLVDGVNAQILAAIAGLLFGMAVMYFVIKPKKDTGENSFSISDIERWHLQEEWADILSGTKDKTARELALEELKTVDQILEDREEEYQDIKKKLRAASKEFKQELEHLDKEETPAIKLAAANTVLPAIMIRITGLRKLTENHINALLPIEWRKEFLQLVRDNNTKSTIRRQLNREDLIVQIKDSMTKQVDYLHSEFKALTGGDETGTDELLTKLFGSKIQ